MSQSTWTLVNPVAQRRVSEDERIVTRTTPIRTLGFLENHKANAAELQRETARRLGSTVRLEHLFYGKPTASLAAPKDLVDRIAEECDVVVVGSAD